MSDEEIEAVRMAANNAGDDVMVKLCTQVLERRGQHRQRLIDDGGRGMTTTTAMTYKWWEDYPDTMTHEQKVTLAVREGIHPRMAELVWSKDDDVSATAPGEFEYYGDGSVVLKVESPKLGTQSVILDFQDLEAIGGRKLRINRKRHGEGYTAFIWIAGKRCPLQVFLFGKPKMRFVNGNSLDLRRVNHYP
jgi:hypothetical protein